LKYLIFFCTFATNNETMTKQNGDLTQAECLYHGHLVLKNEIEEISKLEGFMETIGEATGIDLSLVVSLNLALEEAVTNVISYAYPEGQEGTVDIDVRATKEQLEFVISDSGIPFDPTTKEDADITLGVEERPIGGLGIFLVRQLMDTILYEYKDKKNILTLRKQLTANN